jgi:hypothetical protein
MAGQAPPGWAKKILHAGLAFEDGGRRAVTPCRENTRNRKVSA